MQNTLSYPKQKIYFLIVVISISCMLLITGCINKPTDPTETQDKNLSTPRTDTAQMQERIERIKKSVVRILIDDQPSGTGFVISQDGRIATNFHVIQPAQPTEDGNFGRPIKVAFQDGEKFEASLDKSCTGKKMSEAESKDYAILKIDTKNLSILKLGSFEDTSEGSFVYLSGFPYTVPSPITATGILSTKWTDKDKDVAWLDITMNSGNSGGPVMLLGNTPEDDKVVCIAEFNLTFFVSEAQKLIEIADTYPATAIISGINIKELAFLIGNALKTNSVGVGGCVSINYLKKAL